MSSEEDVNKDKMLSTQSFIAFIFAFILVQLYFISPAYFIFKYNRKYIEKKHIPFLQIFLNLLNCVTYVVIAQIGPGDNQNFITNSIGSCLCLIIIIYLWISLSKKVKSNHLLYFFILINIIFQIYYFIFKYKADLSNYITIINNIAMYLSLNIGTYFAFKEKKPDRIPICSAFLGLLSSIGWTIYSITLGNKQTDPITFFSNLLSFLVLISTIFCYYYLDCCYKNKNKTNELSSENQQTI
jgi:hypothetical protein